MAHEILDTYREGERQGQEQDLDSHIEKSAPKPIGVIFKNVGFTYPEKSSPALQNLNFTIEAGSQTALIGPSGSGKSTIADLLCLIVHPTSGLILRTDGSGEPTGLGGRVSYVPQKPGIVSGTILDNVALGVDFEQVDRDAVEEALRISHLGELLDTLPEGIDTALGKLMDNLSGGQMQRIGLARALYFKPSLLVMDEATSALDAESESQIYAALNQMRGEVTVVMIAHRLNTVQHANKVFLMESGTIVDSGTFQDLLARNHSIQRLVELMRVDE
jgi:ATP-binding cassette subfamily C protein